MRKHLALIAIVLVSIASHFAFFGYPRETVFDEVHFGKFVSGYFTHEYFFDIHPPLGKLIISGAARAAGFQPGFSFGSIGDVFPDNTYLAMRLLPTLAGTLLPIVVFLLALELGFSKPAATGAGLLVALESALVIQSRFMLLDAFLLLFGFLAFLFYAKSYTLHATRYTILAAFFAGLALSVKWTGATFLGIIGLAELITILRQRSWRRLINIAILITIPFAIYFSLFALHFSLLNLPGSGDAFMSQDFRDGKFSTFQKFTELNEETYRANARLTAGHPYSSAWYTWPFMLRSIYYWNDLGAKIYLLGNPIVWWASTFGIFYLLMAVVTGQYRGWQPRLMALAYVVNLLPFIGITRAMFLYHYFTALIIAILALAYVIDRNKHRSQIVASLVLASIIAFIYFAPITYGKPELTQRQFDRRMWLRSWE